MEEGGEEGERVDEREKKVYLGRRTMDCSTGEGESVKRISIGISE
jgi:hypothetical protein